MECLATVELDGAPDKVDISVIRRVRLGGAALMLGGAALISGCFDGHWSESQVNP